ncbi:MAG: hypothetical protein QM778_28190 [Myxococcales bacterium]
MRITRSCFLCLWAVAGASTAGCLVPDIPDDIFLTDASYVVADDAGADDDDPTETPEPGDGDGDGAGPSDLSDAGTADHDGGKGSSTPPNSNCDFSGRWLMTTRSVAAGLQVKQAGIWWFYLELGQSGDKLEISKGLVCGTTVKKIDALSAAVNMDSSFAGILANNPLAGATGTVSGSSTCTLKMKRVYTVLGASPDFRDPKTTLPPLEQMGSSGSPGWEDWDKDGDPGSTLTVSGDVASGKRAESIRNWFEIAGTATKKGTLFTVPMDWNQEEVVYKVSSEILKATGAKVADKSLHFAQLAKLSESQGMGSDSEICAEMRKLAVTLTPEANK